MTPTTTQTLRSVTGGLYYRLNGLTVVPNCNDPRMSHPTGDLRRADNLRRDLVNPFSNALHEALGHQFYKEFVDNPDPGDRPPQDCPNRTLFFLRGGDELRQAAERILAANHPLSGCTEGPPLEAAFLVHAWEILYFAAAEVLHEEGASDPAQGFLSIEHWSLGDAGKRQPRVRFDAGVTALPQFLGFPIVEEHCLPRHPVRGVLDSQTQRHLGFGIESGLLLFAEEHYRLPAKLTSRLTAVHSPTGDAWIVGNLLEGFERPELQVYAPTQENYPARQPVTWAPSG